MSAAVVLTAYSDSLARTDQPWIWVGKLGVVLVVGNLGTYSHVCTFNQHHGGHVLHIHLAQQCELELEHMF